MIRILTAGESHGKALVVVIDGFPSGVGIDTQFINKELSRRQKGYGRGKRMNIEKDRIKIVSGVRGGKTIGSPISFLIENKDYKKWEKVMDTEKIRDATKAVLIPRPGHADLSGALKFGAYDIRDILERASARETASRVAAGGLLKIFLANFGIRIYSHTISIGDVFIKNRRLSFEQAENTPLRCIDPEAEKKMIFLIDEVKERGDTIGGMSEIIIQNPPIGLGSHTFFDKRLDSKIGEAMLSIPSVKGVEIGSAFENSTKRGSEVHDEIFYDDKKGFFRNTNRAGGIEGGISTGEDIIVRIAVKPLPTLMRPLQSVDTKTKKAVKAHIERSDVCIVPAAGVIAESMLAIVISNFICEKFGCDNLEDIKNCYENYLRRIKNG